DMLVGRRGEHGVRQFAPHHGRQRAAPGSEDMAWQAEGREQAALALHAQPSNRGQAQPVGQVFQSGRHGRTGRKDTLGDQGLRTASEIVTGPSDSITSAYETRSKTRNTNSTP